jgi:hypothetical protein
MMIWTLLETVKICLRLLPTLKVPNSLIFPLQETHRRLVQATRHHPSPLLHHPEVLVLQLLLTVAWMLPIMPPQSHLKDLAYPLRVLALEVPLPLLAVGHRREVKMGSFTFICSTRPPRWKGTIQPPLDG